MEKPSDSSLLPPIEEERGDDPELINSRSENSVEPELDDNHQAELADNVPQDSAEAIGDIENNEQNKSVELEENNGDELRIETDEEYEEVDDDGVGDVTSDSPLWPSNLEFDQNSNISPPNDVSQDHEKLEEIAEETVMDPDEAATEEQNLGSVEGLETIIKKESSENFKTQFITPNYNDFKDLEGGSRSFLSDEDSELSDSRISENVKDQENSSDIENLEAEAESLPEETISSLDDTYSMADSREMNNLFMEDILENVIDNTFEHFEEKREFEDSIRLAKAQRQIKAGKMEEAKKLEKQRKKAVKRLLKRSFLWKSEESKLISEIESLINKRKKDVIERATLKPFTLVNSFGYNKDLRILCLNVKGDIQLCLACSHSCMLYSVLTKKVVILQGHRNLVSCFCNEPSGQWIATADIGPDNSIVIWDFKNSYPLHTIFSPNPKGTRKIAFSSDSQYLISVSAEQEQIMMIWKWSKGNTDPDATCLLPNDCDCSPIRRLDTDPINSHYFLCTFDNRVVFITFREGKKLLVQHYPKEDKKLKNCGKMTSSAYGLRTHMAYTATSKGYVILWSDVSFEKSLKTDKIVSNDKEFIEIIKLKDCSINEIKCIQDKRRLIVTADDKGVISFHDITLRLMIWCQKSIDQPIRFVELSPQRLKKTQQVLKKVTWPKGYYQQQRIDISDTNMPNETAKCKNPGVSNVFRKIFIMKMFIVVTKSGDILKMDCEEQMYEKIFSARTEPMTSIACHTNKDFIYVGTQNGDIYLYDFVNKIVLLKTTVKEGNRVHNKHYSVTSIAIGNLGLELAVGIEDGSLHFYHSVLLTHQETFHNSKSAIRNIVFDKNCNYLAHLDDEKSVSLYNVADKKVFLGRYQSHYENVTDLIFTDKKCNLISIGEDSKLSTYFLGNDGEDVDIGVSKAMDERAIPLTLVPYYKPEGIIADKTQGEEFVLISNSKFKFNVCSTVSKECVKTLQAPCHATPIRFMRTLPPDYVSGERKPKYLVYATDNEIGLLALPADGNPYKSLAVIGSPTKIHQISVSYDNRYLFTLSKNDESLLIWQIDPLAVQLSTFYGGPGLQPYYSLLDGGRDGWLMNEIKDYFYYFQLVHEGELMMSKREVSNRIHLCDLFNFLNAVGYFPSKTEKNSIYSEVRRRHHTKSDHQITLDFDFVLQLYLNHKPALGIQEQEVKNAFSTLVKHRSNISLSRSALAIDKNSFTRLLSDSVGEDMTAEEMRIILSTLATGSLEPSPVKSAEDEYSFLPKEINYTYFIEELMGLEINDDNLTHLEKDSLSNSIGSINSLLSDLQ